MSITQGFEKIGQEKGEFTRIKPSDLPTSITFKELLEKVAELQNQCTVSIDYTRLMAHQETINFHLEDDTHVATISLFDGHIYITDRFKTDDAQKG